MNVTLGTICDDLEIKLPKHIAIICDGNGRWAKAKGLSRSLGHNAGRKPIEETTKICSRIGIKALTFYIFSTENWNRSSEEIQFLMKLFIEFFIKLRKEAGKDIKVKHIGSKDSLSPELINEIQKTEKTTENNSGMILNIALNYGGRLEITNAAKKIIHDTLEGNINTDNIDENLVDSYMLTSGVSEVDLIIRTSGEKRISNFLLWQTAHAELWVTDELWPDFNSTHLEEAIAFYNRRRV